MQNHPVSTLCLAAVSPCTLLLLPAIPLPHSSNPPCSFSRTSQHHSLHRALFFCAAFARKFLESHQTAAKLRALFVQMLLATPSHCEVVMTACSIASFLPVNSFLFADSLRCSTCRKDPVLFTQGGMQQKIVNYMTRNRFLIKHT